MTAPGRNDPCPCGSGKKFKQCCLSRTQAATGITPQDRTAAVAALLKFSRQDQFDPLVPNAAREWSDLPDASMQEAFDRILQFEASAAAFFDWLFFDVTGDTGQTIADTFVERRAWTVAKPVLDYIQLMRPTALRLYQVRDVDVGIGLHVRDLWTKRDLVISERLGSRQLVRWDVLCARIVAHADGTHQIEGTVMALPPAAAKSLLRELKSEYKVWARGRETEPNDFFKFSAPLLHDAWLDAVALQEPPTLTTVEGDPISMSTLVFDVPQAGEALARLLTEPDFEADTIGRAIWIEGDDDRRRILGDVEVHKGTLTLGTHSRARATRGRARLEAILGPLTLRRETHEAFDPTAAMEAGPPPTAGNMTAEIPEMERLWEQMDRAWLDTEVPALDNRTPRQAARDKRLRPRLRELLLTIENQTARINGSPRDYSWMWNELGLRKP